MTEPDERPSIEFFNESMTMMDEANEVFTELQEHQLVSKDTLVLAFFAFTCTAALVAAISGVAAELRALRDDCSDYFCPVFWANPDETEPVCCP
jgi:hypothetical protein